MSTALAAERLTPRQLEILDFIAGHISQYGWAPTIREIGDAFGIRSPNGVMCHLNGLESKGFIVCGGFQARAIRVVGYRFVQEQHHGENTECR